MFQRYAVYFTPDGEMGAAGAAWLGRDIFKGEPVTQPEFEGLDLPRLTERPRRYGFHATIVPPFRLHPDTGEADVRRALDELGGELRAVPLSGLQVTSLGRFLALTLPRDAATTPDALAARAVEAFHPLRTPLDQEEIDRRMRPHLTKRQAANLCHYGYPHVMEDFRFHMTLTDRLDGPGIAARAAESWFGEVLATPVQLSHLSLVGEDTEGLFRVLQQVPLKD